jgi:hypothetical protein
LRTAVAIVPASNSSRHQTQAFRTSTAHASERANYIGMQMVGKFQA